MSLSPAAVPPAGARVILAERFGCLGGNLTLGHVSPILGKVAPGTMADELRSLFTAAHPGERSVNATQVNGIDALDPAALGRADAELRRQIDQCVAFLRNHVPGYENCRVKSTAATVGVRETRRIVGDAAVTDADVEEGRHYDDAIVHDAWFLIDIHNPTGGGQAEGHSHPAKPYDIRYGAFLPKGIDGLLVAGRCISGTHRAHASYRVMTPCMAMGEAAGVAAALAAARGVAPREVAPADICAALVGTLKGQGVFLG